MNELIAVNINIGDTNYRVKVLPENEASLRQTAKLINDKLIEFRSNYAGQGMKDYLGMVLLWFATEYSNKINQTIDNDSMQADLNNMNSLLDDILDADENS